MVLANLEIAWEGEPMAFTHRTKTEVLARIDKIRETLSATDRNNGTLVSVIRDLWDGGDPSEIKDAARRLTLSDYDAEQQIKTMVAGLW